MNTSALASIERLSQAWWDWVVAASWQLAVLTCLVAVAVTLLRRASPRLRHALWLLVVLKAFLPPGLTAPWSVGRLAWPWLDAAGVLTWRVAIEHGPEKPALNAPQTAEAMSGGQARESNGAAAEPTPVGVATVEMRLPTTVWLMFAWGAGLIAFWGLVAGRYLRLLVTLRDAQVIDEGPLRIKLERIALALGVNRVPELLVTPQVTSPFLFGVIRPRIVLPAAMIDGLGNQEMRAVLTHELMHWQRHDVLLGWLQVGAQGLFWFHPLVWWANRELRHERECACDEAVLRHGNLPSRQYGDSIVRVLTTDRGRSLAAGSLVGVFERGTKLQNRLEEIMDFETRPRTSSWFSRVTLVAFALLALPMAPGGVRPTAAADDKNAVIAPAAQAPAAEPTPYPQIVSTVPPVGATNVDPTFSEITVTFDRDMQGGMSWTGGPPEFPDTRGKAKWKDRRTCVLPVKLAAASIYRVGINSTSFQNFRSAGGVAARPAAIYFVTKGASPDMILRVRVPQVVTIVPAEGATDVDPSIKQLRVTFDMPMGDGMSWVDAGPNFPPPDRAKQAAWSADGLTCTLPVELEPGRDYKFGLNDLNHINFQSRHGVPLVPVVYRFRTAAK